MRLLSSRGTWLLLLTTSSTLALAQPAERDHRRRPPPPPTAPTPPPPAAGPTEAPPPPQAETVAPRAGFVFVRGHWDWRGKWEWVAGHWERERAGKHWRDGRWDQRDSKWVWVAGDWEAGASAPPPATTPPPGPPATTPPPPTTPPPGPPGPPGRHREWKLERPVVSSYWPVKGKVGSRIVIRGKNFPASAEVLFAGQPVKGAKITAEQVVFMVPPGAASGSISLRASGRRELPVGTFEVAAAYDPVAEQKRIEEEQRKQAEAAWAARQQQLAKDRAAREAAIREAMEQRAATRDQRRAERVAALQAKFKRDFLADQDTQDELTLHAQRVAELTRARDVAEVAANGKLVVRIELAQTREEQRHDQRMAALEASFKARGGTP